MGRSRPSGSKLLAPWSLSGSEEEVRDYIHERLSLYSKMMMVIFWILVGFVVSLYKVYPNTRPGDADIIHSFAYLGLVTMLVVWYVWLVRGKPTLRVLYRIDYVYCLVIGLAFGISAYYSWDRPANVYTALIWNTYMVFTRALLIPSTPRRTFWCSTGAMVPLTTASILVAIYHPGAMGLPGPALVVGTALFVGTAILLATIGTRVIYGLRKQIREAQQLGQYTLREQIGRGGMGQVFKAEHAMLRRPTAIKLLPPDKYSEESLQRFEREVQLTSQLTHPNTVEIYDYGRSPDGVFYYAMEYLDGIDLDTLVQRYGAQPASRVIHILEQVAGALDEAHDAGLIHRDVKPANIILSQRGRRPDVAKVLDFGLVKQLGADTTNISTNRVVAGTPAYISPEAVTHPDTVGTASDIYSLGAVAYFLLCGKRVFDANTDVDMCVKHVSQKPEPPSERTGNPIPPELESLVMQCLAKSADKRPGSAEELRVELERMKLAHPWNLDEARDWWSERARGSLTEIPVQDDSTLASPMLMTVDLRGRTGSIADVSVLQDSVERALDQNEETGQAT